MESPTSSRPDALDPFEERALGLLGGAEGPEGWNALLGALVEAEGKEGDQGKLYREPPRIDPSEGRRSMAELRRLIDALGGAPPDPVPPRTRAGYALEGTGDGEARVIPAFVAALPPRADLQALFPDLWAVDADLWEHLEGTDLPTLARLWLESPGRRLVQDLQALRRALGRYGATDFSRDRLALAAGVGQLHPFDFPDWPPWRELHLAVPGVDLARWRPHADGEPVVRALQLLEVGSPFGLRGAALAWLLNRAADDPFYKVENLGRDLREDLPFRLSTALATWLGDDRASSISRELETLSLQHAARIFAGDVSPDSVRKAWSVARWLQKCLGLSPFFGGDEEALAAHLHALLPRPVATDEHMDALHPARFSLDGGLDVAEIAFLAGVLAHYKRELGHALLPTPVPIVNALLKIAGREVRPEEEAASAALAAGHNALGWPDRYPIAPPIAARKVMTELRIGWVAHVSVKAQLDTIERFARDPREHDWVAFALNRESPKLVDQAAKRVAEAFDALSPGESAEPHVLATLGVAGLAHLDDAAAERVLTLAMKGDATWRPFVADALAGAAERLDRMQVWEAALEQLLALMEDVGLGNKARLNAALFALQRASGAKSEGRAGFLDRIAAIASGPPFSEHPGLRREVRRLGPASPAAAGGKR